jgi:hypothetical protein
MSEELEPAVGPLEEAIRAFQRMSVPERPPDADVLARLGAEPSTRRGNLLRFVISSAAAAVLVFGLIGLLLFNTTASIALADVVKAAERHKLVRYHEAQFTDTNAPIATRRDSIVHADLTAPRLHSESRIAQPDVGGVLVSVHDGRRHLKTDSRQRTATLDFAPKGYKSLLCCLEEFQAKQGVVQRTDNLGGIFAIVYRLQEERQTTALWVDAQTKLPLRLDREFFDPTAESPHSRLIWTEFAWDPELPIGFRSLDDLFSTRPPDGYVVHDLTRKEKGE